MQQIPTLAEAIQEAVDFQSALSITLSQVCEFSKWDYGEAWTPCEEGRLLELSPAWYKTTYKDSACLLSLEQFRVCSEKFVLAPGIGLPGRVWSSQKPEWINDVTTGSETYFLRHYIAKALGIRTGLGVPAIANHQIQAVLVFFMLETRQQDKQTVELAETAAAQLGKWLHCS